LKLTIGDCDIPERFLLYVTLSSGSFAVSFGGAARRDEIAQIQRKLKILAEQSALPYDAVDKNGVGSTGICNLKNLKFQVAPSNPAIIRFSGLLVHPFI
jgi:hypothetical protein